MVRHGQSFVCTRMPWHPSALAVVAINTDQTANNGQTTDPGTGVPYDNVGMRGSSGASVVYLGNQWALTAAHVTVIPGNPAYDYVQLWNPSINGYQDYTVDSTKAITNSDSSATDLKLIHLTTAPDLPSINIAPTPPPFNPATPTPVVMIGNGQNLGTQQSYTYDDLVYTGYNLTGDSNVPRWGTNVIDNWSASNQLYNLSDTPSGPFMYGFTTTFNSDPTAANQEAQATPGDSGGGVFEQIGSSWYLVGLIDGLANVPMGAGSSDYENNVWFGEQSFMADLAYYGPTITALTPEPSSFVLAGLGLGSVLAIGWRARRRRRSAACRQR